MLEQETDKDGYCRVRLYNGKTYRHRQVHALVLEAFIGPRPSERHVSRHLNGTRSSNHAANLAWGTQKENCGDKVAHGTQQIGSAHPRAKITETDAARIKSMLKDGASIKRTAENVGVSFWIVADISRGRTWGHV